MDAVWFCYSDQKLARVSRLTREKGTGMLETKLPSHHKASFCISDSEDGGWVGVEGAESEIKRESQTGRTCEHSENFLLPT